jgi:hypothetical protein
VAAVLPAALYLWDVHRITRNGRCWSSGRTAAFLTGAGLTGLSLSPVLDPVSADLSRASAGCTWCTAWPPGGGHTVAEVEQAAQWMYYGGTWPTSRC